MDQKPAASGKTKLIIIAAVVVVVIIVLLAIPYFSGGKVKGVYDEAYANIDKQAFLTVKSESYKRGIFKSVSRYTLEYSTPGSQSVITIEGRDVIKHGYSSKALVSTRASTSLKSGGETAMELPNFTAESTISAGGKMKSRIKFAPFKSPEGGPVNITWNGATIEAEGSHKPQSGKGTIVITPVKVESPFGNGSTKGMSIDFDMKEGPSGLLIGKQNIKFGGFDVDAGPMKVSMKGFSITGEATENGGLMKSAGKLDIKETDYRGKTYGPGGFNAEVLNIHAPTLKKIQDVGKKMQQTVAGGGEPDPKMQQEMMELLASLSKQVPEMNIKGLNFKTPDGDIKGFLNLKVDGSKGQLAANPMAAMGAVVLDADFSVPSVIIDKNAARRGSLAQIESLLEAKYLIREGTNYRTTIKLNDGKIVINGQAVDNPMALMMAGQSPPMGSAGSGGGMGSLQPCAPSQPMVTLTPTPKKSAPAPEWDSEPARRSFSAPRVTESTDLATLEKKSAGAWSARSDAARRLAASGSDSAVAALKDALKNDPDPFVRREAARSLGAIGDPGSVLSLRAALKDSNYWVRRNAAIALEIMGRDK